MMKINSALYIRLVLFFLSGILLFAAGCKKEAATNVPVNDVDFTFTEVSPGKITFTSTTPNATEYAWDFGDGSFGSAEKSPTHSYFAAGNYQVRLTAKDGNTLKGSKTQIITIAAPATPTVAYLRAIEITKVIVMEGESDNSAPDIYFHLKKNGSTINSGKIKDDLADSELPFGRELPARVKLDPLTATFEIAFYEENRFLPDDDIQTLSFSPASFSTSNFPSKIPFDLNEIAGNIFLDWE